MRHQILNTYDMTLDMARRLVADVPDERFAELPHEGAKHPAWVLQHLAVASGMAGSTLAADPSDAADQLTGVPAAWMHAAGPGKPLTDQRADYGSKDDLLAHLERVHAIARQRFAHASDAFLASEFPIPDYRGFWPTRADCAAYMLAHHEGYHLGQLAVWRRAVGLPSASMF